MDFQQNLGTLYSLSGNKINVLLLYVADPLKDQCFGDGLSQL